jgi:hypothetical protein
MTRAIVAMIFALLSLTTTQARANPGIVAMIVGVNTSVDVTLPSLRYADDDAVLYSQLFRQLGATTLLLTRLDDNTRRLHPEFANDARLPRRDELSRAVAEAAATVAAARARGERTVFYFVYAGHGNVHDGQGSIGLEDDRLTGADLAQWVLGAVAADQMHVVIDACYSGLLAGTRGPGGDRRPLHGFSQLQSLASNDRIGLLLSTSSARESHEWEGFQAGVFSYEVRSGMYGAADADGDGYVSYREIAAFVTRANAAILNERFRPDISARPPRSSDQFLDLRHALHRRIEINGRMPGHYVLEDKLGVRILDFHNAPDQPVAIIRSSGGNDLFLRRTNDNQEYRVVVGAKDVVTLEELDAGAPHVASRGAAHEAFNQTFLLQFDRGVVQRFDALSQDVSTTVQGGAGRTWPRSGRAADDTARLKTAQIDEVLRRTASGRNLRIAAIAAGAAGLVALGVGAYFGVRARSLSDQVSNAEAYDGSRDRDGKAANRNMLSFAGFGGTALVTAGILYYLGHRAGQTAASDGTVTIAPVMARNQLTVVAQRHF